MKMNPYSILVVDDDDAVAVVLTSLLQQAGFESVACSSGASALEVLKKRDFDVVITDLKMPKMDGMQLLAEIRQHDANQPVLMLTAHATIELAVEAMRLGAHDFLLKPFDREELLFVVDKAIRKAQPEELTRQPSCTKIIGISDPDADPNPNPNAMAEVHHLIAKAARSKATVLIRGESGSGKEVAARAVHAESDRASGPFVKVHCGALPDNLLESELFGYEKGAFTGAVTRKPGRVELAEGGTLFLDEIGDISPVVQVKLLRLLQEKAFERLGGHQTLTPDIRIVAATHRDLEAMIQDGSFREDLFYRLNVIPITIPPLRDRRDQIEELARHFFEKGKMENGRSEMSLSDAAVQRIASALWPGNVRQLENFVERLVVLADDDRIEPLHIERELARDKNTGKERETPSGGSLDDSRRESERSAIDRALSRTGGNRTAAARVLGISRRTLYNKMKDLGLCPNILQ